MGSEYDYYCCCMLRIVYHPRGYMIDRSYLYVLSMIVDSIIDHMMSVVTVCILTVC